VGLKASVLIKKTKENAEVRGAWRPGLWGMVELSVKNTLS